MKCEEREILLVDDDPIVNFLHSEVIQSRIQNLPISIFENGSLALDYIRKHPDREYLIFLDINMPVMNGWEFLEALSQEKYKYNTNIHLLTSSIDKSDRQKANEFKVVQSYLSKPLTKNQLEQNESIFAAN